MKRTLIYSFAVIILAACSAPKAEENKEPVTTETKEAPPVSIEHPGAPTDSFSVTNPTKVDVDSMKFITMIEESKLIYEAKLNELQKAIEERETVIGNMSNLIQNLKKEKEDDAIADSLYHAQTATIIDSLNGKTKLYSGQISQIREILSSPEQK